MDIVTVLGFVAATCTTISFLPQVLHTIRTKDTSGISTGMYVLFVLGTIGWFSYGILTHCMPVVVANGITMILASVVLYYKLTDKDGK